MVTSLHREMEQAINIDMESSNRDDDVIIITNLSSVEASYTVLQGKKSIQKYKVFTAHKPLRKFYLVAPLQATGSMGPSLDEIQLNHSNVCVQQSWEKSAWMFCHISFKQRIA